MITTGVGLHGHSTLYIQPPIDDQIDPVLHDLQPAYVNHALGTNTTNIVPQVGTPSSASTSEAPPPTPAAPHSFSNIL